MAYLDLDTLFTTPADRRVQAAAAPAAVMTGFTALEWSVIALARRDTIRSLSTPGPIARTMGSVFGRSTASRLADPRLEALRRIAVHAWHHGFALPISEIRAFLAAGYDEAQIETLVTSITGMRTGQRTRGARA